MSDATVNPQDWFGGLSGARQGGGGNYANRGEYVARILNLERKVSTDPKKSGHRLIVGELEIVEVLTRFDADPSLGRAGAASNRVGERIGFYADLSGAYPTMEQGKVRGIVEAGVGPLSDEDIADFLKEAGQPLSAGADPWAALAGYLTTPPGTALAGTLIRVSAGVKTTKAKEKIVVPTYYHIPAAAPQEAK